MAAIATRYQAWTDEQLLSLPRGGREHELLDGGLTISPVHSTHDLGEVYDWSTGCRLSRGPLPGPDVSFISNARLMARRPGEGFPQDTADLMVEVLSPTDRIQPAHRKLEQYFEHATRLAWLINPRREIVHTYTEDSIDALTNPDDWLTGGEVPPGFKCRLSRLFPPS